MKLFIYLFCLNAFSALSQLGSAFPKVSGHLLNDQSSVIPAKNQKYSVVAIAYHRDAEDQLKEWLNPLYSVFIKKNNGGQFDMAEIYDVNFVFVPLISGFKKLADDFKKGTDKEFWPYIMDTEKTDIKEIQKGLGITNSKIPYFYVLDKEGKIVAMQSGKFNQTKLDILEDAID